MKPGTPLRFGITPGIQTGQLGTGPSPPRTPEDPARHMAALETLRPPRRDLVLRLHRFFWSDGEEGVQRFLALADRYTARGFGVELQLRYHPTPEQEGDIGAWVAFVRDVVRRFGANPRVVAIQVTNEVNLTFSPDSSDGAYEGAREALVQGVIAAADEKRQDRLEGRDRLQLGLPRRPGAGHVVLERAARPRRQAVRRRARLGRRRRLSRDAVPAGAHRGRRARRDGQRVRLRALLHGHPRHPGDGARSTSRRTAGRRRPSAARSSRCG